MIAVELVLYACIIRVVRHWEARDSIKQIEIFWRENTLFRDINHEHLQTRISSLGEKSAGEDPVYGEQGSNCIFGMRYSHPAW